MAETEPAQEALRTFRAQYPQYNDLSDQALAQKIISKYPEYKDALTGIAAQPSPDVVARDAQEAATAPPIDRPPPQDVRGPTPGFFELTKESPVLGLGGQSVSPIALGTNLAPPEGTTLQQVGLPVAGELIGGQVGRLGGPLAPVTVPLARAAGAAGGEYLAQKAGISPESNLQLALAAAGPAAGALLKASPKVAARVGPVYERGQRRAAEEIRGLEETVKKGESKELYRETREAIKAGPPPIATARTQKAIAELADELPKDPQDPRLLKVSNVLKQLETTILQDTPQGTVASVRDLRAQLRDLKHILKTPEAQHLYGAIIEDLDAAAAGGHRAAAVLRAASNAWKAERGAARFAELTSRAIKEKEGLTRVNAENLIRILDQDRGPNGIWHWLPETEIDRLKGEVARRASGPKIKLGGVGLTLESLLTKVAAGGWATHAGMPWPFVVAAGAAGAAWPTVRTLGWEGIKEAAEHADNPHAGQIVSMILQGLRVEASD
jgi:hypothetical protein